MSDENSRYSMLSCYLRSKSNYEYFHDFDDSRLPVSQGQYEITLTTMCSLHMYIYIENYTP